MKSPNAGKLWQGMVDRKTDYPGTLSANEYKVERLALRLLQAGAKALAKRRKQQHPLAACNDDSHLSPVSDTRSGGQIKDAQRRFVSPDQPGYSTNACDDRANLRGNNATTSMAVFGLVIAASRPDC